MIQGCCIIPHVTRTGSVGTSILIGALLGGVMGFMLRPSALGTGQLPFETVLTAGSNLRGIDQLLQPVAQRSFKYLIVGVILGAIAGLIIGSFAQRPVARRPNRTRTSTTTTSTTGAFCAN